MTNTNEPRYDWDDPITHTARQAGQVVTQSVDRALQLGYMLQTLRSQRLQQQLDTLNHQVGTTYQTPETVEQLTQATNNVQPGDLVAYNPSQTQLGHVTTTSPDGHIEVAPLDGGRPQTIQPGEYGIIPQQTQPTQDNPDPKARQRPNIDDGPRPEVKKPLEPGETVTALDRGNHGHIIDIDGDQATVRFTNTQTGASRDVQLRLDQLKRRAKARSAPTQPNPQQLGGKPTRQSTGGPGRTRLANPQKNKAPHRATTPTRPASTSRPQTEVEPLTTPNTEPTPHSLAPPRPSHKPIKDDRITLGLHRVIVRRGGPSISTAELCRSMRRQRRVSHQHAYPNGDQAQPTTTVFVACGFWLV